ncbi:MULTISPECIES: twin-arginine translocase TatA/TatE family subunit [unclassified Sorangium]|jgi:sec-independent protein translocase protein TatA|uniref:twin-arginine translocase TatA/TatE family subunit n=1 Tax=unclassified Sorangium TaxID=2621164 RepID=UPI003F6087D9
MGRIGPLEIALLIGLALLLFGAGRIADIGKGIGEGIRNFKKGIRDDEDEDPAKQLPAKPEEKQEDTQKPV